MRPRVQGKDSWINYVLFILKKISQFLTLPLLQLYNDIHGNRRHWRKSYLPQTCEVGIFIILTILLSILYDSNWNTEKICTLWEYLNLNKISFETNSFESYSKHLTHFWLNSWIKFICLNFLVFFIAIHYIAVLSAHLSLKVRTSVCSKVTFHKNAKINVFSQSTLKLVIVPKNNPAGIS